MFAMFTICCWPLPMVTNVSVTPGSSPATVSQAIEFRPIPHVALTSLAFRAKVKGSTAGTLAVRLQYLDGTQEEKEFPLPSSPQEWTPFSADLKARTDFDRLVATKAVFEIRVPAGPGTLQIDEVEVERDGDVER